MTERQSGQTGRHIFDRLRSDLAVLNEPQDVFEAVVVEEDGLQYWSV